MSVLNRKLDRLVRPLKSHFFRYGLPVPLDHTLLQTSRLKHLAFKHLIFNPILHGGGQILPCRNFSLNIEKLRQSFGLCFEGFLKISGQ